MRASGLKASILSGAWPITLKCKVKHATPETCDARRSSSDHVSAQQPRSTIPLTGSFCNEEALEARHAVHQAKTQIAGQPDRPMKAGDSYQIPAGAVHDGKSGAAGAKVLATYTVENGKPFAVPAAK